MFPGMNPKKIQAMMKQMGMDQTEIPAKRVIIEQEDGNIIIEDPSVLKIIMQGQTQFQVSGEPTEESSVSEEDIQAVMEKTSCSEEDAKSALEKADGDIAEAIIGLS